MSQSSRCIKMSVLVVATAISSALAENKNQIYGEKNNGERNTQIITVYATGNERDSFTLPMMSTVIKNNSALTETAGSATELLRHIPGISISGAGRTNGETISMRGYSSNGVLTLVDGIRQGTDTGHIDSIFVDPLLIKQVEVVRGPSALLYGSGALGGVVAYDTVDASDLLAKNEHGGVRVTALGNTAQQSQGFGITAFGQQDNFDGLLALSARDKGTTRYGGGYRAQNDETIINLLSKGRWFIDDSNTLSGQLRYYHNNAQQPKDPQLANNPTPANVATNRTTTQKDAQLTYQYHPSDMSWINLKTQAYYSEVDINAKTQQKGFEGREQKTYGIKLENRTQLTTYPFAAHALTYGGEIYKQKQSPSANAESFPKADIRFMSGWLQDEMTLRDVPISFIVGTRFDKYSSQNDRYDDISADKWSSKGAVSITPTDWLMLYTSYAQAFRAPTIGEMYNDAKHFDAPFPGVPTNYWRPNPNLKPETNSTTEYGFGFQFDDLLSNNDNLKIKAAHFNTRAKDYIDTDVAIFQGYTQSTNIPRATIWGWDIEMNYQSKFFSWDLAYNHTKGKDNASNASITSIEPDTLTSRLDIPVPNSDFSVGWVGQFTKKTDFTKHDRFNRPTNRQQAGYGVNDFYLRYEGSASLTGLTTSLVLGNAFDKKYYSSAGIPQEGRNAKVLVSYQW
ncbi:TPA: TonB-dependent hemoglobin/transferrin/lactoferrin family receptor [Proteus mirabilis]|uniref:TonB-dependent hemoglobin/transferrin/lactoferrin family receptor n=1 Tax=Proteus mirabilis TaxID=584 RepID=UPI0007689479|nr:TonB-dependent hemoglobin/transferrin/lactoferrin family receptor [Proteus mirabilis]ELA7633457.1 TonB-dependent hemoglobin/transferrin/lactoferrin family receptor [Proteus mirabilis]ELA7717419.1 TonB-dependent hemoglobin/transferrin/lactoferrin family receptor [Proteus mirabilis]MBG5954288.1 TonB-dependent hemoglobin/transferrin/lactoferrin family receptor [Proteus mirabilis]MBI6313988.1 TonB-dependent hemoglobin/transferrin/lactoferrin family receptor [Proteus mirabilis]MBI6321188.1 TonB-